MEKKTAADQALEDWVTETDDKGQYPEQPAALKFTKFIPDQRK